MDRNLDGCYFRVERNGHYCSVCFSDMTEEERAQVIGERPAEWWKSLAYHLADCLRDFGEVFDVIGE